MLKNVRKKLRHVSETKRSAQRFRNVHAPIVPRPRNTANDPQESLDVWGFADTHFRMKSNRSVELTGGRYTLSGKELPSLVPWIEQVMNIRVEPNDVHVSNYPPAIPAPRENTAFNQAIGRIFGADQISTEARLRLRHGHGHTQHEMYAIKYDTLPRVPDMVVYPSNEAQVVALVSAARQHNVCLIPYGGGTNVTEALLCPTDEQRTIVSVDMKRMQGILWVDPINRTACIQAGAVGRHIMEQLKGHGFTMGHEPDSVEFSTLGGWIATHASGMKKNRYGNIEDIVMDFNVVTADGVLTRDCCGPRESVGSDPRRWVFGSEGTLGIITQAIVKLFPLPEVQRYGSIVFPNLEDGVGFLYELSQTGALPASVRLVDNLQFQFGMALKPASGGLKAIKKRVEKLYVADVLGFDPQRMTACTLVFEGSDREVQEQERVVYELANRFGGLKAGSENGEQGYQLTYGIAYIRDFVMQHHVLAESFETSVPWSRVLELIDNVKRRIYREHDARGLPGRPFVTARVTQVYDTGVAVYFYFGFYHKGVEEPSRVYSEIEVAAREEILRSGGSLSHHHGIGKLRQQFLPDIMSETAIAWNLNAKRAIDPQNIFGSRNHAMDAALIEKAPLTQAV